MQSLDAIARFDFARIRSYQLRRRVTDADTASTTGNVVPEASMEKSGVLFVLASACVFQRSADQVHPEFRSFLTDEQIVRWGRKVREAVAAIRRSEYLGPVTTYGSQGLVVIELGDADRALLITLDEDSAWASYRRVPDDFSSYAEHELSAVPAEGELRELFAEYQSVANNRWWTNIASFPSQHSSAVDFETTGRIQSTFETKLQAAFSTR